MSRRGVEHDAVRAVQARQFAAALAAVLHDLRLTHKALAARLGVTHHTVDSWTRIADPMLPSAVNLERLIAVLEHARPGAGGPVAAAAARPAAVAPIDRPLPPPVGALTNLPPALTSFIGRESQIRALTQLLGQQRVLTLTGAGGVGKTRLALQVAARALPAFAHGVWLVPLEEVRDPGLVPAALAAVFPIRATGGRPLLAEVVAYLQDRQILLVLDNCEHLIETVAPLAETLLQRCPRLHLLMTSREGLRCQGEAVWGVGSLTLPTADRPPAVAVAALQESEAGRLFLARAAAHLAFTLKADNAAALVHICQQLEGIPLALELAAAQVDGLTVRQIAERLDGLFGVLTAGPRTVIPRHRTLRACIDWSYDLLPPAEQAVLRRLGVFQGGWTLAAAEVVCAGAGVARAAVPELLTALVRKSLVSAADQGGRMRYRLLETVRQYAEEQLVAHREAAATQARHARYFLTLADDLRYDYLWRVPDTAAIAALRAEIDNLRAALTWSLAAGGGRADTPAGERLEIGLQIASALYDFWTEWDHQPEGEAWLARMLAAGDPRQRTAARAHALTVHCMFAVQQGRFVGLEAAIAESTGLWEELLAGGAGAIPPRTAARWGLALSMRGVQRLRQGRPTDGRRDLDAALTLFRTAGARLSVGMTLFVWAEAALELETEDLAVVQARLEESVATLRLEVPGRESVPLNTLGRVAWLQGHYATAQQHIEAGLALLQAGGSVWLRARALNSLAEVLRCQGAYADSLARSRASLALFRETGDESGVAWALYNLGVVASYQGQYEQAGPLLRESLGLRRQQAHPVEIGRTLTALAEVALGLGDPERAAGLLGAAEGALAPLRTPWSPADAVRVAATAQTVRAQLGTAFRRAHQAGAARGLDHGVEVALAAGPS